MDVSETNERLVALNLGLIVFLPIPFQSYAKQLSDLFARYTELVPRSTFRWQNLGGTSEAYRPLSKTAFATIDAWLNLRKRYGSGCAIWLKDGDSTSSAGDHLFDFYGRDTPEFDGDSNFLQVLWPATGTSAEALLAGAKAMLASVPFHSVYLGYTLGLTTLFNVSGYSKHVAAHTYAMARRFRGVEVFMPHLENYEMALHARPPAWVTFLSKQFIEALGGERALRTGLGSGDYELGRLGHGLWVRAGQAPRLADANRGEDVAPEQKTLARLMRPLYSNKPAFLFDGRPHEDTMAWLRRHL